MSDQGMQTGTFCWTELCTRDVEAAKKFYGELIGWTYEESDMGQFKYTMFKTPGTGQFVGGMMPINAPQFEGVPPHWMPYITVENVDASLEKCKALGGEVVHPPTDIPQTGRFCVIKDPTGAVISLFHPVPQE